MYDYILIGVAANMFARRPLNVDSSDILFSLADYPLVSCISYSFCPFSLWVLFKSVMRCSHQHCLLPRCDMYIHCLYCDLLINPGFRIEDSVFQFSWASLLFKSSSLLCSISMCSKLWISCFTSNWFWHISTR